MGKGRLEELSEELRLHATSLNALAEIYDDSSQKEIFDELELQNRKAKLKQVKNKAQRVTFSIEKKLSEMRFLLNV